MDSKQAMNGKPSNKKIKIVFVLGGPGSGKGTQCVKIVEHFGFTHFSAGDLLRAETKSGSEYGTMIQNLMKEGKLVDSSIIVRLIQKAMLESENDKFLIDGFPRNEENRIAFEKIVNIEPEFLLFLDCPETELEKRLLSRNQGREDDNIETIKKRFKVFMESTLPVVSYYEQRGRVRKVNAAKSPEEVFEDIKAIFSSFQGNDIGYRQIAIEAKPEHSASLIKCCLPFLCCLNMHQRK
ncbi:UMP-CMP kinase [Rhynchospora pubera]|uniref:UMP-CMP kinase n=1 Tax=Rhynchospora pubera TaxID=906938 RepID=A0AAV8GEI7_9POAL|nr:UMP-CMP kinase [Rhynchospora pubera]